MSSTACGQAVREPLDLVHFDFQADPQEGALGPSFGGPIALGAFAEGFTPPEGSGMWTLGREATARFFVVGRELVLKVALSTSPPLSARGQWADLYWNDQAIGRIPLDRGWEVHADTLAIEEDMVEEGWNRLRIVPRVVNQGDVDDPRPLGVYLRRLSLQSQATAQEAAKRQEILDTDEFGQRERDEWAYAEAEVTRMRPAATGGFGPAMSKPAPDVMFIVLDAARADHFGGYGYERDTTPFVDRLAEEGVTWTQAFALSPFTLTSMASVFTGLSWRDHHVVEAEDALDPSFWTLAQLFQMNGYETVGFSDNPYVGHASRLMRGFRQFTEVRTHPRQVEYKKTIDTSAPGYVQHRPPEMVQWLFEDWVDQGVSEQAYLLYFHIMPPHSPYVPGDEHDLWADPQYRGAVDGSAEQLKEFVDHQMDYDSADLRRLISLYDGNLHRADEVARKIFEKWKSLRRGRDLLVVLLSDHGEAFGEHGDFEHLTTVYDEMLHVPVVFWPRQAWAALEPKREGLHSLCEIMPMLLEKVQIPLPPGSTWPRYFRQAYADPAESERRAILVRSYAPAGRFGVRSARELFVYGGRGVQGLFDLRTDPGQMQNLRFDRDSAYARRLVSLGKVLMRGPHAAPTETAEYSPEQLEELKALGYVH